MPEPHEHHNQMHYDGDAFTLFMLYVRLILGTILTLGIYNFWGRSNIRRYIVGSILIRKDRYQYHGTGEELFLSFLKFLLFAIIYLGINYALLWSGLHCIGWNSNWFIITVFVINVIFLYSALFYALHRSLKYKLSRISWRGVRYHLSGSSWNFMKLCLNKTVLNIISLGFLVPRSTLEIYQEITNGLYFGDQHYRFKFDQHNLLKPHLISLLLFIPTLGLSRAWYWARLYKFMMDRIEFMDLELTTTTTPSGLIQLYLTNLLLIIFTAGLGIPLAIHRSYKFHVENIAIIGDLDRKRIVQSRTLH